LLYRAGRGLLELDNKIVIVADDGVATGATMRAALKTIKKQNPKKIILAVPVCPPEELKELCALVDEAVCLYEPKDFWGIGAFYDQFDQVSDAQVIALMRKQTI
jgi:predicted phosphoribosyltransferase